ncbi:alpha/beta hydrolase [Leptospira sp. WS39.C2]
MSRIDFLICGNIRLTKQFRFKEIKIPSLNGYDLPGWLVLAKENKDHDPKKGKGVVILVHGGGVDRRELTRYLPFYLELGYDTISFDLSCHGESPCLVPGLSFGNIETRDVLSVYLYVKKIYKNIFMFGSSVGGSSILIALPFLNDVKGVVVENPMISFDRIILDSPESNKLPNKMITSLIELVKIRGKFDSMWSPKNSLHLVSDSPIFMIHSKNDKVVSYKHSESLLFENRGSIENLYGAIPYMGQWHHFREKIRFWHRAFCRREGDGNSVEVRLVQGSHSN